MQTRALAPSPRKENTEGTAGPPPLPKNVKILTTRLEAGYSLAFLYFEFKNQTAASHVTPSLNREGSADPTSLGFFPQAPSAHSHAKATAALSRNRGQRGSRLGQVQPRLLQRWSLSTNWELKMKFYSHPYIYSL